MRMRRPNLHGPCPASLAAAVAAANCYVHTLTCRSLLTPVIGLFGPSPQLVQGLGVLNAWRYSSTRNDYSIDGFEKPTQLLFWLLITAAESLVIA